MTVKTSARAAGVCYFLYLVAGMGSMAALGVPNLANTVMAFCALGFGVTLYALTRSVDHDLATLAMACRLLEAAPGNGEIFFAVGSAIFSWLLLRGRLIPSSLAMLGLVSSALLAMLLLLQSAGLFGGRTDWSSPVTWFIWLPVLVFELAFMVWLLTKGVAPAAEPAAR
jgi:hypothetical protein